MWLYVLYCTVNGIVGFPFFVHVLYKSSVCLVRVCMHIMNMFPVNLFL